MSSFPLQTNVETMLEKAEKHNDNMAKEIEEMKTQIEETREKSQHLMQLQEQNKDISDKLDMVLKALSKSSDLSGNMKRRGRQK